MKQAIACFLLCVIINVVINMISMTQRQMIQYLRDYANIQSLLLADPTKTIGQAFNFYMHSTTRFEDPTEEYFHRMLRVYSNYVQLKLFSITEDFLLNRDDYLSNNDLDELTGSNLCKYIEKPANLTNKRTIQLIRNAFNHNGENGIERFRISKNGKYFEIEFNDIRTAKEINNNVAVKPVKIDFDFDYLLKLNSIFNSKRQSIPFLSFILSEDFNINADNLNNELKKINFIHYYFTKKMDSETVKKFYDLSKNNGLSNEELNENSKKMDELAKSIGDVVEYNLTYTQKERLKTLITRSRELFPYVEDYYRPLMYYFLGRVIPVPAFKYRDMQQQCALSIGYFTDPNMSINTLCKRLERILFNEKKPSYYTKMDSALHDALIEKDYIYKRSFYNNVFEGNFMQGFPIIMYADAVILNFCHDEIITIDGVNYSREKIRNSLAHCRWYIANNNELMLYDADPRNINDYNLEEVAKINILSLKEWADNYMDIVTYYKNKSR